MADMQVVTKTSILREHFIPEASAIALLKLDVPNGSTLSRVQLVGTVEGNMLLVVTQEPTTEVGKIVTL